MSFFVYMLGSADRDGVRTYVGWTTEPERRLAEHNGGRGARSTRGRSWTMIHLEELDSKRAAMSREWHLKRDRRRRRALADAWRAMAAAGADTAAGRPADPAHRAADLPAPIHARRRMRAAREPA
jgi:putative endonuclease